jgi:hypothetical protein
MKSGWAFGNITPSTAIRSGLPVHRGRAELLAISAPRDILTIRLGGLRNVRCVSEH